MLISQKGIDAENLPNDYPDQLALPNRSLATIRITLFVIYTM